MKIGFFILACWSIALAGSEFPKTYYDKGGMPRCVAVSREDQILLVWDENELFERPVRGVSLNDIPLSSQERLTLGCASWGLLTARVPYGGGVTIESDLNPFELEVDSLNLKKLDQVRRGGTTYRSETTVEEFLDKHPIAHFDRETNRRLTAQYGVGFVNEIYRNLVYSKPRNEEFQTLIKSKLILEIGDQLPPMNVRFKGYTFALVSGYMQAPSNDRIAPIMNSLKSQGLDALMLRINPVGGMVENAALVKDQLEELLKQGKKLIVISGSKGSPELLGALAALGPQIDSQSKGAVKAFVSLSGVLEGSFIVDWAMKVPQKFIALKEMEKESKLMGLQWQPDGFKSMQTREVEKFAAKNILGKLPHSVSYFGIIGIPGGNGLVLDKNISILQNSVVRNHLHGFGANDGYVEFPGTSLSEKLVPTAYEIVFDSSHIVLDGHYFSYDMSKENQREFVFNAVFEALADVSGI